MEEYLTNLAADNPLAIVIGFVALVILGRIFKILSRFFRYKKEVLVPQTQAFLKEQPWGDNWQMTIRPKDHPLKIEYNFQKGNWKDAVEGANLADEKKMSHVINDWYDNRVDNY
jgi:hypothetical protein